MARYFGRGSKTKLFRVGKSVLGRARVSGVGVEDSGKPHERVERCIAADRRREWPVACQLALIGSAAFFLFDSAG
jgi:hypothetical protein